MSLDIPCCYYTLPMQEEHVTHGLSPFYSMLADFIISNYVKKLFNKTFAARISIYFLSSSLITHSFHRNNHVHCRFYPLFGAKITIFKCMQLKEHKLNGSSELRGACLLNVREVFVSKNF